MLNPDEDPGVRQRRHAMPSDISISSDNSQQDILNLSEASVPVATTRRVIHHSAAKHNKDSDDVCSALKPTFYIVAICCLLTTSIAVSVFMITLMPAVRDAKMVMGTIAERMPQTMTLLDEVDVLMRNKTRQILSDTVDAMDRFANMVKVLEEGVTDPRFQTNVEALFSSFVQEDLKSTLAEVRGAVNAFTLLTNSVRTNGMQAQLTVPLSYPLPAVSTTAAPTNGG